MPHDWRAPTLLAPFVLLAGAVSGCLGPSHATSGSADPAPPEPGACRLLSPHDVAQPSNDTATVACDRPHTAATYAVGPLPAEFAAASYDDADVASFAYRVCSQRFLRYTGADESLAMRTILSWAWFRPTQAAWKAGARWYRCDVIGGGDQTRSYVDLPARTQGLLVGRPKDEWMVCAQGASVTGSVKVPCSDKHDWRAVTTIVLGAPDDAYPGDRVVQLRTRDYCSASVNAWLGYPVDYDFGYSWFHEAEWRAGNRRSVCWARSSS